MRTDCLRSRTVVLILATLVTSAVPRLRAQLPDRLDEALQAIFDRNEYAAESFGPTAWLDGGRRYTSLTRGAARDLVAYDTASGQETVLVSAKDLVPRGSDTPLQISGYSWSSDQSKLLIFTNTRRVWRQNTRGDYWVFDVKTKALRKLGGQAPEASLMFAKFAPDGRKVGYVRAQNIYVEDLAGGRITPLTTDGGGDVINGTSDWVNEEELDLRDCFRWSPDGRRLAYWQFNTSGVERFTLINNTDALYPTLTRFPYPKSGTTNSAVRVGVLSATGGATTWMKTAGDPRNHYVASAEWVDAATLALQQLNRLQNTNELLLADVASGVVRRVHRDQSETWVDVPDEVAWFNQHREFTWVSEHDGWRHVYAVARDGTRERLLTKFDGDITSVDAVDSANGRLYVTASPSNATQRYLYMSRLDGDGAVHRVTPADQPGSHSYDISPDGAWAIHTYSRFDAPPRIEIVSLPDHQVARVVTQNADLAKKIAPQLAQPVEFLSVDIGDGVVLDGYLLKPRAFDPSRKYPIIVHVYGEPAGTTVNDRWGGATILFHRAMTDEGYLVASFDNRGTPAPKGTPWRKVVYGAVGELSAKEQAAAVRRLAADRPYVDLDRVAIYGASGGGSNTLNSMFRFPDVYKVGVSIVPVPDQRLYDTIYQERYMGLPQENEKGYFAGSPINFAPGLRGRLLIVHGTGDDNVHYQGTERLINRLIELGKSFDVMVYPNRTHALSEGRGTRLHLYRLTARYLVEHVPAGPR
ncbi:MAG: S9 family peptidase [Acidobacteria bacterium]|nr:S9 family peptidase [Acidobacteriota bacterium]